jgi:hypothetical protein
MPRDWFTRETLAVLAEFCQVVMVSRQVMVELTAMRGVNPRMYYQLIGKKMRFAALVGTLATKLKLTQHSRWSSKDAGHAEAKATKRTVKPWDKPEPGANAGGTGPGDGGLDSSSLLRAGGKADRPTGDSRLLAKVRARKNLRQSSRDAASDPVVRAEERQN